MAAAEWKDPAIPGLKIAGCYGYAVCIMILLFTLNVIPVHIPGFGVMRPPLVIMMVYFWSVFRPSFISPVTAFLMGLVLDILSGAPFGLMALICVAVQWATKRQRRLLSGQSFYLVWWGFVFIAFTSSLLAWGITSILNLHIIPIFPSLLAAVCGAALFPLVSLPLFSAHRALLSLKTL